MSRTIRVLPDLVANQIAAGEVVERPASVVKELVENALDARATRVDVALERGGKRRIRVSDDGTGMGREDALLSLDRHATSKIAAAEDLQGVRTFGFRGEALPSIAAVSRLTVETCAAHDDVGTSVRANGGAITAIDDFPRRRGTTIEVESLFHKAPARAKFLSSVNVETRAVSEAVVSLALANPGVAFTLTSDDRVLLDLPRAANLRARVAGIWGDEAAEGLLPIGEATESVGGAHETGRSAGRPPVAVHGLVQRPDLARPGFRRAHLFVDGRPFREPALLRAAERGYRTTIAQGVRPWIFLYLRVDPGSVDVNVHPAKAEVRFRDRAVIEAAVEETVRRALGGDESSATFDAGKGSAGMTVHERAAGGAALPSEGFPGARGADDSATGDADRSSAGTADAGDPGTSAAAASESPASSSPGSRSTPRPGSATATGRRSLGLASSGQMALFVTGGDDAPAGGAGDASPRAPSAELASSRLWQVHDTYILAETRDGLLLIDQHSAHERILFESLMRAYGDGGQTVQRLLFPLTLRLSPSEYAEVMALQGLLSRSGFEVEGFGGDTVIVQGVPNPHPYFDAERCFREMIAELTHGSELVRSAGNQHERIAMTFACKGAIKAGQRLDPREMQELFDRLFATELPYHDVHGRPTIVRLGKAELERKFGR